MARHGAVSFLFFLWNFDLGFVLVIEMFIMAYLVDVKG